MDFEKVLDFYRRAISEGRISEGLLSEAKAISDEAELKKFMEEKLLPIAKDMGFEITEEELISYEKDAVEHLSEEELESVTGGSGAKSWALGGLLSVAAILGGGAALNTSHAMKPGGPSAASAPAKANQTQTKTKVVTGDTPAHSGTFTCTYNFGTHQGTLTLKRADGTTYSQVFYSLIGNFSIDEFLTRAEIGLKKDANQTPKGFCEYQASLKRAVISLTPPTAQPNPQAVNPAQTTVAQPKEDPLKITTNPQKRTDVSERMTPEDERCFAILPFGYQRWDVAIKTIDKAKKEIESNPGLSVDDLTTKFIKTRAALHAQMKSQGDIPKPDFNSVKDGLVKGTGMKLKEDGKGEKIGEGDARTVRTFILGTFDILQGMETAFGRRPCVPYLQGNFRESNFTREQCACIIAGGMMGVMAMAGETREFDLGTQMNRGPEFGQLFPGSVHYLHRFILAKNNRTPFRGNVKIRRFLGEKLTEGKMSRPLCKVNIHHGKIDEPEFSTDIQADFANSSIGGGVLGKRGSVQEEIRFGMVSPECLVSLYLGKNFRMNDLEAICIEGAEMFSSYTGYGKSTRWAGDVQDTTERAPDGSVKSCVVAMDATNKPGVREYMPIGFDREMNKAYVAFSASPDMQKKDVSTGLWGCGDFSCSIELKFLQQWIACSCCEKGSADRKMNYSCYLNKEAAELCDGIIQWVEACQITDAATLYQLTMDYCNFMTENFGDVIMTYPQFWRYLAERFGFLPREQCLTKQELQMIEAQKRAEAEARARAEQEQAQGRMRQSQPLQYQQQEAFPRFELPESMRPVGYPSQQPQPPQRQEAFPRFNPPPQYQEAVPQFNPSPQYQEAVPQFNPPPQYQEAVPQFNPSPQYQQASQQRQGPNYEVLWGNLRQIRADQGIGEAIERKIRRGELSSDPAHVFVRYSGHGTAYNISGKELAIRLTENNSAQVLDLNTGSISEFSWGYKDISIYEYNPENGELKSIWQSDENEF